MSFAYFLALITHPPVLTALVDSAFLSGA